VRLKPGDEIRVGPLKFLVASVAGAKAVAAPPDSDAVPVPQTRPRKQPPVKDVADVVERSIKNKQADDSTIEDDISRWLLGPPDPNGDATLKETRSIRLEETKTHKRVSAPAAPIAGAAVENMSEASEDPSEAADDLTDEAGNSFDDEAADAEAETKSGGWSIFRRGKAAAGKQKPGKLPPRPDQPTKDSREAAADILREMQRRR
jgi:hypothetical protein